MICNFTEPKLQLLTNFHPFCKKSIINLIVFLRSQTVHIFIIRNFVCLTTLLNILKYTQNCYIIYQQIKYPVKKSRIDGNVTCYINKMSTFKIKICNRNPFLTKYISKNGLLSNSTNVDKLHKTSDIDFY